jgi:hypothetical protein
MPSVLDEPELIEYVETHELTIERPRSHRARPGFWRTLVHGITKHLTRTPHVRQTPSCSTRHPFKAPMDRLIREHPSLSLLALAII